MNDRPPRGEMAYDAWIQYLEHKPFTYRRHAYSVHGTTTGRFRSTPVTEPPMSFPIVGAFHRPPAKAILQALPLGHPIWLVAEPSNQFDPNAIMAAVEKGTFSSLTPEAYAAMETLCLGFGHEVSELPEMIHLGYIPKTMTNLVHPKLLPQYEGGPPALLVVLSATSDGKPSVIVE